MRVSGNGTLVRDFRKVRDDYELQMLFDGVSASASMKATGGSELQFDIAQSLVTR